MCITHDSSTLRMTTATSSDTPSCAPEEKEGTEDECQDDCSLGVADLVEDERTPAVVPVEGGSEGCPRTISPISQGENQESSSLTLSMQNGSSLSRLDLLRERNRQMRRRGSLKIAELRRSLNASSTSLAVINQKERRTSLGDESTVATVSSRTWTETPSPTSSNSSSSKLLCPIPFEVEMNSTHPLDNKSISGLATASAFNIHMQHCNRLKQENDLLRHQVNRLVEHHNFVLRKERKALRIEIQNRAKARRNRLRLVMLMLVAGCLGQFLLNIYHTDDVSSRMGATILLLEPLPLQVDTDIVEGGSPHGLEDITNDYLVLASTFAPTIPLDFTPVPDHTASNNTIEVSQNEDLQEAMSIRQTRVHTKQGHRLGFLKRLLFNIRNDHLGVWLKPGNM